MDDNYRVNNVVQIFIVDLKDKKRDCEIRKICLLRFLDHREQSFTNNRECSPTLRQIEARPTESVAVGASKVGRKFLESRVFVNVCLHVSPLISSNSQSLGRQPEMSGGIFIIPSGRRILHNCIFVLRFLV